MSNYIITRDLLKKRFSDGGATTVESDRIISAIFSYLELVAGGSGSALTGLPIELVFYDFRFLYSLYTNDQFARQFFSVYRDVANHAITFSSSADENDHIIRESTGLNNGENGLYLYILNFNKNIMTAKLSLADSFTINNPGEDVFSKKLDSTDRMSNFQSPIVPRTDDRRSYTDSVMNVTPQIGIVVDPATLPDDYKTISPANANSVPFMNGSPGSVSADRIRTSASSVVRHPNNSNSKGLRSNSSSSVNIDSTSKYPVLEFILKSTRR